MERPAPQSHTLPEQERMFGQFIKGRGLKKSQQRNFVLRMFLQSQEHLNARELYRRVRRRRPEIGYTTVYRTLKLIVACGLAEQVDFDDGAKRYELKIGREYHAHFICTRCRSHFEAFDGDIERLAARLAAQNRFEPQKHRLEIFGVCRACQ